MYIHIAKEEDPQMYEKLQQMIKDLLKKFRHSFKKDKETWQDMYSVLRSYTKELKKLSKITDKKQVENFYYSDYG